MTVRLLRIHFPTRYDASGTEFWVAISRYDRFPLTTGILLSFVSLLTFLPFGPGLTASSIVHVQKIPLVLVERLVNVGI